MNGDLAEFLFKVSQGEPIGIFGKTGHGKTTFCKVLTLDILLSSPDAKVYYIDTEGGARDLTEIVKRLEEVERIPSRNFHYLRAMTNDQVIKYIAKIGKSVEGGGSHVIIIDSISMPCLIQWARSRKYDERIITMLELVNAISRLKEICERNRERSLPVLVLHPVSEIAISRELQRVAKKLSETAGLGKKVSVDSLPDEIVLQYQRPAGGKALHLIKELWLMNKECSGTLASLVEQDILGDEEEQYITERLSKVLRESARSSLSEHMRDIKLAKFRVRSSRSRVFPDMEPLVDIYVVTDHLGNTYYMYRTLKKMETTRREIRLLT